MYATQPSRRATCFGSGALLLLALATIALLVQPIGDVYVKAKQAPHESARSDFERARMGEKAKRIEGMSKAVAELKKSRHHDAARYMIGLLLRHQRGAEADVLPTEIHAEIAKALHGFGDRKTIKYLEKQVKELKSDEDPTLAVDQFTYLFVLAGMEQHAGEPAVRKALKDKKNPYLRLAALEAIRAANAHAYLDDVLALLNDKKRLALKEWPIIAVNLFACLRDVTPRGKVTITKAAVNVVEACAHWQLQTRCDSPRVLYFAAEMLTHLTGEKIGLDYTGYWLWWVGQKWSNSEDNPSVVRPGRTVTPVFGGKLRGDRVAFVIDVSDNLKLPLHPEFKKKHSKRTTCKGKEKSDDFNPLSKLPWDRIETKLDLAREELARSIMALEEDVSFAIITYSKKVRFRTEGWIAATEDARKHWAKEARKLEPDSTTNIHGALTRAFEIHDGGNRAENSGVNQDCMLSGAHTVVFLTGGWANWSDDSTSRDLDDPRGGEGVIGDGTHILGPDIWPDIIRQNLFRKVIINTVGIGHHDKKLMKALARESGGTYVDWYFPES